MPAERVLMRQAREIIRLKFSASIPTREIAFEREVIGERVRDKIAASKRKGIWVGGPVPLGYAAVDKKVVVVPAEAEAARAAWQHRQGARTV